MNYLIVLQQQLQSMAVAAAAALPALAIALMVIGIAWGLARFAARIVHAATGHTRIRNDLKELLETLVKVAIWVVGLLLAATIAIPGFTFGGMVAGLGIGAVAIGFAFQDIFKNFLAGVLIMLREKMRIGDEIDCESIRGTIEHISLRETHVRQPSGELIIVPNSLLFEKPVRIITDQALRRDEIVVPIDTGSDLEAARDAVSQALAGVAAIDDTHAAQVLARGFDGGTGAVELTVRWWTNAQENAVVAVRSEVVIAIAKGLAKAGVSLPSSTTELVASDAAPFPVALRVAR